MAEPLKLTPEEIEAAASGPNAWPREVLQSWGVPFPPPRGWRRALLRGEPVPSHTVARQKHIERNEVRAKARPKKHSPSDLRRRARGRLPDNIRPCEPRCVECGQVATELVPWTRIYAARPHRPDLMIKRFWLCGCGAYVGCHQGTDIALGYPAGPATQAARRAAHAAFDPLWEGKIKRDGCSKSEAREAGYVWLAAGLGLTREACHIAMMDAGAARRVVELCKGDRRGQDA